MRENLAPPTSKTLIGKLANTGNRAEWRAAWARFVQLYGPIVIAWGRKYRVPEDQLEELPGTMLLKLHRTMRYWEFRRWFIAVADVGGVDLLNQAQAAGAASKSKTQMPVVQKDYWRLFLRSLKPEILESLAIHQTIVADPGHAEWPQAWKGFAKAISPSLDGWLEGYQLESNCREALIRTFLERLAQVIPATNEANLPRFHSWLHMVVKNATRDMLNEMEDLKDYEEVLKCVPARQDLFAEIERREVREEAERRARKQVSDRDWDIYWQFVHEKKPAREVADHWQITVNNVNKIVGRVRKIVRAEIEVLITDADGNDDGE